MHTLLDLVTSGSSRTLHQVKQRAGRGFRAREFCTTALGIAIDQI